MLEELLLGVLVTAAYAHAEFLTP